MRLTKHFLLPLALLTGLATLNSCVDTRKAIYFNNIQDTVLRNAAVTSQPAIQNNDILTIAVSSLNPDASAIFNMAPASASSGSSMQTTGVLAVTGAPAVPVPGGTSQVSGYLVGDDGTIKFPVLGRIHASGLTKKQLEDEIEDSLAQKKLLVDPIVNVRFLNFRVTVLGEVARPSTINVTNERISILEALGLCGDLTIFGKRNNVLLIREENNTKIIERLDLTSSALLTSPYYYLKTNDIVYVEPNKTKVASATRGQQLLPILLSGLSIILIIISYYIKP